ncbi:MAG: hypothetical protein FWF22_08635 [Treponema sp.]|nr:hypothetical protein [Treponema sp.]
MRKLILLFAAFIVLFSSCSSQVSGVLRGGGSADLVIKASLQPRMSALIRSLKTVLGNSNTAIAASGTDLILDGVSITRSMQASPGVSSVQFTNSGPAALDGTIAVSKVEDFLSSGASTQFITFSESSVNGKPSGRILISLDRKTIPALLVYFSAETSDYLSALMAPAVIDEDISKTDYLSLVSSLYGQGVADEIQAASINVTLQLPGPVTSVRGGSFTGNQAVFDVSVLDLLVLDTPLSWEIVW